MVSKKSGNVGDQNFPKKKKAGEKLEKKTDRIKKVSEKFGRGGIRENEMAGENMEKGIRA